MKLLENLDLQNCLSYPEDMEDNPWSLQLFMDSMQMALSGTSDEALMDLEKKYAMNYGHLYKVHPPWMTLAPPQDLKCWGPILLEQKIDIARIEGQVKASSVKRVAEFVDKHPEESVSIIRGWLHESA